MLNQARNRTRLDAPSPRDVPGPWDLTNHLSAPQLWSDHFCVMVRRVNFRMPGIPLPTARHSLDYCGDNTARSVAAFVLEELPSLDFISIRPCQNLPGVPLGDLFLQQRKLLNNRHVSVFAGRVREATLTQHFRRSLASVRYRRID